MRLVSKNKSLLKVLKPEYPNSVTMSDWYSSRYRSFTCCLAGRTNLTAFQNLQRFGTPVCLTKETATNFRRSHHPNRSWIRLEECCYVIQALQVAHCSDVCLTPIWWPIYHKPVASLNTNDRSPIGG
jgi:hypothetical protein